MQFVDLPSGFRSLRFDYPIHKIILSDKEKVLILNVRDDLKKATYLYKVPLNALTKERINLKIGWFEDLVGVSRDYVYTIVYEDRNDPSKCHFARYDVSGQKVEKVSDIPQFNFSGDEPFLYEHGTAFYQIVKKFLELDLPLACEYYEKRGNIIISYYLRSGERFNRYLLLLKEGKKVWSIEQDREMKGFSSGAFFVFDDQVIFIKDRNEICFYNL
ncbi:MAG: hypothetical protein GDA42_10280 [Ekhidna sp.]|nr:hypothetical protein [Ekhidna sp.]